MPDEELEAALQFGTLPTPRPNETQADANKRIVFAMIRAGASPPDPDTPLGEWVKNLDGPVEDFLRTNRA